MELYKVVWFDANVRFEEYFATPDLETLKKAMHPREFDFEILDTNLNIL